MISKILPTALLLVPLLCSGSVPKLPGVGDAMQACVDAKSVAGAVTVVVTRDKLLHCESTGYADLTARRAMTPETMFWIASMTKPITASAVLMLQDEGKLNVADPVAKYLPEFAGLKTPSGKPARITIAQILTHTSGLGEPKAEDAKRSRTLAELTPHILAAPMQYEPGARWKYTQSGINLAGRIVEVVSHQTFDAFLEQRLFRPLGMRHTTFYPTTAESQALLVTAYAKSKEGSLEPVPPRADFGTKDRPPLGNGGLFSTALDYARFCQLLLNDGVFEGKRLLSPAAVRLISTVQTGDIPCGFFQSAAFGNRGSNYGWGIGTCVLKTPHDGVAAMLSPGTFGHGGAWGTQAWIDPVKGMAYVLMVQRSNFPNSDASDVREAFQKAVVASFSKEAKAKAAQERQSLFDGKSFNGWTQAPFSTQTKIAVVPSFSEGRPAIVAEKSDYLSGITWADGDSVPRTNYEISLDAMKLDGEDFFCGLTFPIGKSACTLIVGGWGGMVVGLSNVDFMDASENATTSGKTFASNRWYHIRLRVTPEKVEAWIDQEQVIDIETKERTFSLRQGEIKFSEPLGLSAFQVKAAWRDITLKRL